ncbi:hypothetical protein KQX54_014479 [Cotesia glomerata]|uniref:Uncharacterized protein n=1 Tax=Cotesia glomerata TaxID=32391 RepID=A0AAV7IVH2_COTGL|nr:hypothetical protein KQX54_014479 [Cotesia glomerata]
MRLLEHNHRRLLASKQQPGARSTPACSSEPYHRHPPMSVLPSTTSLTFLTHILPSAIWTLITVLTYTAGNPTTNRSLGVISIRKFNFPVKIPPGVGGRDDPALNGEYLSTS